ncbi:MAG: hypothetical protein HOY69_14560 [Streptomyces sp.]|nr:hypothetical protein [Streptomyces sp.]
MAELPESVDRDILEGRPIHAVKTIRESQGCSLPEAVDLYARRCAELRPEPDAAAGERPGPRVLRFEPDGSLHVVEAPPGPDTGGRTSA